MYIFGVRSTEGKPVEEEVGDEGRGARVSLPQLSDLVMISSLTVFCPRDFHLSFMYS